MREAGKLDRSQRHKSMPSNRELLWVTDYSLRWWKKERKTKTFHSWSTLLIERNKHTARRSVMIDSNDLGGARYSCLGRWHVWGWNTRTCDLVSGMRWGRDEGRISLLRCGLSTLFIQTAYVISLPIKLIKNSTLTTSFLSFKKTSNQLSVFGV